MKITISKSDWKRIGETNGWMKKADAGDPESSNSQRISDLSSRLQEVNRELERMTPSGLHPDIVEACMELHTAINRLKRMLEKHNS